MLYPTDHDRFFAGPGAAVRPRSSPGSSFNATRTGKITSLTWQRDGAPPRIARRVEIERHEDVRFSNGDIQLAGTLITSDQRREASGDHSRPRLRRRRIASRCFPLPGF